MSSTDGESGPRVTAATEGMREIFEQFSSFVSTNVTTLEQYEAARARSEEISMQMEPLMKEEKAFRTASKRALAKASSVRDQINTLTAEKQEKDYLIREALRSPYSPLKAFFRDERRGMGGQRH